jgi:hypothetical protein
MDVDHNGGTIELGSEATAGDGVFTLEGSDFAGANGAQMLISSTSTAGNATLIVDGGKVAGGNLFFQNNATGGTARVEVFSNGRLDISGHELPGITIGSIEGDGLILVGANQLMTGNNNVSTTFSGLLQDGGFYGGSGGALAKIGNGKLTLSGRIPIPGAPSLTPVHCLSPTDVVPAQAGARFRLMPVNSAGQVRSPAT